MLQSVHRLVDWAASIMQVTAKPSSRPVEFLQLLEDNEAWISSLEFDCSDELTAPLIKAGFIKKWMENDRGLHFSLTLSGYKHLLLLER